MQDMRPRLPMTLGEDERVAYMTTVVVPDRTGIKPTDYDPQEETNVLGSLSHKEPRARLAS
jgi:hypothetical protein